MSLRDTRPSGRLPTLARPRRMQRLATLPLFFPLGGRRAVVVGGSEAAAWKAELLSAAGATVDVRDPDPCAEMKALAADPPGGAVILDRRRWSPECLAGASLVVGAAHDEAEAARLFDAARASGVPVNIIDKPRYCTFQFGAIVNRSPLVIGISTGGAAPIFGQAIRSRIEALVPAGFKHWAVAAKRWRGELTKRDLAAPARRRFWERFTDLAFDAPDRAPTGADRLMALADAGKEDDAHLSAGHVTLVGAGPGNPELLTLRAVRALRCADVILFDDLVAPEILDFARREAKRMLVGKTGYGPSCKQDDINNLMVSLARSGRRVVRLKSGDPMIFGRAGEEIAALVAAGIPFEIVPGVTAAQGAAAALQVSLTQRAGVRRLQYVTGHARDGHLPKDLDVAALCDPKATTAVYMPLGTLRDLASSLLAKGIEPSRPVTAVFNATRPDQHVVSATVATIADRVEAEDVAGPCVVLIGEILRPPASARAPVQAGAAGRMRGTTVP